VFLTAYSTKTFIGYVNTLKVKSVYEKPLQIDTFVNILKDSNLI